MATYLRYFCIRKSCSRIYIQKTQYLQDNQLMARVREDDHLRITVAASIAAVPTSDASLAYASSILVAQALTGVIASYTACRSTDNS